MILKATREHATNNSQTYFLISKTWEGRRLFRAEPWARLFFEILLSHRGEPYLLHEFVLMPDHFHLLLTPSIPLERAMQLIKGGFSFRAKREFASNAEIWQRGFSDHRIRDAEDYETHVHYIHLNPVKKHLCQKPGEYKYSSAYPGWRLDPIPQGLKPRALVEAACGTAKAVPFQNNGMTGGAGKAVHFQNDGVISGAAKAVPFQNNVMTGGAGKAVPFQNDGVIGGAAEAVSCQNDGMILDAAEAVPFQNNGMIGGAGKAAHFQNKDSFMSNNAGSIQQR